MKYLIRYGEISLKSRQVREKFEALLKKNIKEACRKKELKGKISSSRGRLLLDCKGNAGKVLERCFGVVSFSSVEECAPELGEIRKIVEKIKVEKGETFKLDVNRAWKGFRSTSKKVEELLGSVVLEKTGARVDLSAPDKTIYVEIGKKSAYVFSEKTPGPGGMPFASAGTGILLISGKNSMVAGWLMMKRGMRVIPLHIGKKDIKKAAGLVSGLSCFAPEGIPLLACPCEPGSKKRVLGIAEGVCKKKKALCIVTGDLIKGALKNRGSVLCPLVGFDTKELSLLAGGIPKSKERVKREIIPIVEG